MPLVASGAVLVFYEDAANYAVADYHFHRRTLPLGFPAVLIASELWSALILMLPLIILLDPYRLATVPPIHPAGKRRRRCLAVTNRDHIRERDPSFRDRGSR